MQMSFNIVTKIL